MLISLTCFSSPGAREATAREAPILRSDLAGVFPTNLIFPNTELKGVKGVGSSTVTAPETSESCKPVTYSWGGGISYGGGGTGQ